MSFKVAQFPSCFLLPNYYGMNSLLAHMMLYSKALGNLHGEPLNQDSDKLIFLFYLFFIVVIVLFSQLFDSK